MTRAAVLAACALVGVAAPPPARPTPQTPAGQQPVFAGRVDLVTLDVTVVDKDGKPVKGLKPEDFVVSLEGQTRPVVALDFMEFGTKAAPAAVAAGRETTNQTANPAAASRGGRVIVLLFDDLSYKPGPGKSLLVAAERMLSTFDLDDLVGITTTSGLGPTVNPTRDRSAILAALHDKKMIGRNDDITAPFYITVPEAIDIDRGMPRETLGEVAARECPLLSLPVDQCTPMVEATGRAFAQQLIHRTAMQLASFQHLMGALRTAPAPRVVIALSNGVAIGSEIDLKRQLDPLGRAAAENGVQFYALTEVTDGIDMGDITETRAAARRQEGFFLNSGAQTVAEAAGGEAFLVVGQADRFFARIESETSGIYRLGVQAPALNGKQRFLSSKVSVRRPGTTVRVNRDALVGAVAAEPVSIDEQLKANLGRGGVAFGVPIALATAQRRDPATNDLQLGVNVQVPGSVSGPIVAMYALVDDQGKITQAGRREVPSAAAGEDYRLAFPVPIDAGKYRLRFAVADAKGNVGSVEHEVTAGLAHVGAFSVSDLFTAWIGADGVPQFLALERLPDGAQTLQAELELYPDDAATPVPDVAIRIVMTPVGSETPVFEREITPDVSGTTRIAVADVPVAPLKAGAYAIRATIVQAGAVTGAVTTMFRKTGG
ncbi:MAG TPA: VWA domain-containing protein [Vicinamibacterales bacterium]|nr:VWA domain-containing protein [Vicinamibacterales bacterium]